jgi:hypothetical protein
VNNGKPGLAATVFAIAISGYCTASADSSAQADSATVVRGVIAGVEGSALIARGSEFVAAGEGMELHDLNQLFVLEESQATVEFSDGCRYEMAENSILTVGAESACTDATVIEKSATSQAAVLPAPAVVGPAVVAGTGGAFVVGALGAAGVVGFSASNNNDGKNVISAPQDPPFLTRE